MRNIVVKTFFALVIIQPVRIGFAQEPIFFKRLPNQEGIRALKFSPDGRLLASGGTDRTVRLWDNETGKQKTLCSLDTGMMISCAFSKNGKTIATANGGNSLALWNIETGKLVKNFPTRNLGVFCVASSPDGELLVAAGFKILTIWSLTRLEKVNEFPQNFYVQSVAVSGKSDLLAIGGKSLDVIIMDIKTGKTLQSYSHNHAINSVAFYGNDLLASGSDDTTIILWDIKHKQETRRLRGHKAEVTSVVFSSDGKLLFSGSVDGTIKLWDVSTGKEVASLQTDHSWVLSLALSPDGRLLASGGLDKNGKVWTLKQKSD